MRTLAFLFFTFCFIQLFAGWEPFSPSGIHANKITFYVDNNNNWAVSHDNGIYLYNLNFQTWINYPGVYSPVHDASWLNGDSILFVQGETNMSTDGIYTLNPASGYYGEVLDFLSPNFIEIDGMLGRFFVGGKNRFAYSDDGNLWYIYPEFTQKTIVDMDIHGGHYVISRLDTAHNIYLSNDGGINWETVVGAPVISDLEFAPSGKLYGIFPGESWSSGLWSSNDFGQTWAVEFWAININCVGTDFFGNVFVGFGADAQPPEQGIARWDSLDQQLYFLNEGLPNLEINQITINPAMSAPALFCCTEDGVHINHTYVGVEETKAQSASLEVWPNPGSDILNIRHGMEGSIEIEIYTSAGRLMDGKHKDEKTIRYDCSAFEPGIYFVRINDGKGSNCAKWIKR